MLHQAALIFALPLASARVEPPPEPLGGPPEVLELVWSATEECPSRAFVIAEIDRLLVGSSVAREGVRVDARVTRHEEAFELALTLEQEGETGVRHLRDADCSALAKATAFIVASGIDPKATAAQSADVAPQSTSPVRPPKPAQTQPEVAPTPSRRFVPHFVGHVAGGVSLALAPTWGAAVQAGLGLGWRRFQLRAVTSGWLPRTVRGGPDDAIAAQIQMWTAGVLACPLLRPHARVSIPLCLGVHGGAMLGRGTRGIVSPRRAVRPWAGFSANPALVVHALPWLGVRLGADVFAGVVRPSFATTQGSRVFRADVVGATFSLGLEFRAGRS